MHAVDIILLIFIGALVLMLIIAFFSLYINKKNLKKLIESSSAQQERQQQEKKEALLKFKTLLLELCITELIYIEYFNDIYQLNRVSVKYFSDSGKYLVDSNGIQFDEKNLACGKYVYLKKEYDTPVQRSLSKLPRIELKKDYDLWTLAHELGHHFTIQYQNIETEEAANLYIKTLAEQFLTKEEQEYLDIEIMVYSGTKKYLYT